MIHDSEMEPGAEIEDGLILGVMEMGEVGFLLEEKGVDLMELWGLVVVEELVGVGHVEEGVVSEGDCFGLSWVLSPGGDFLWVHPY